MLLKECNQVEQYVQQVNFSSIFVKSWKLLLTEIKNVTYSLTIQVSDKLHAEKALASVAEHLMDQISCLFQIWCFFSSLWAVQEAGASVWSFDRRQWRKVSRGHRCLCCYSCMQGWQSWTRQWCCIRRAISSCLNVAWLSSKNHWKLYNLHYTTYVKFGGLPIYIAIFVARWNFHCELFVLSTARSYTRVCQDDIM